MAVRTIPCRVCGKLFVPCNKSSSAIGAFNYREVACSPECGTEYLRRVQAARQNSSDISVAAVSTDDKNVNDEKATPKRTRGQRRKMNLIEDKEG